VRAHVAVAPSGEVKVKKLTVATDVGMQVHPDNIRAQVEGAAAVGAFACHVREGDVEGRRYRADQLRQLYAAADEVSCGSRISVIANGEKPTGVGEPAVTVIAPALANAIFNASGAASARCRSRRRP